MEQCNGLCVNESTKTKDLKYTYVYHNRDGIASPAVVFHDKSKCLMWKEEGERDG